MRKIKRVFAVLLAAMLLMTSALAEARLVPQADDWHLEASPVQVTLSVQVSSMAEYDETRVAQLNALMKDGGVK